MNFRSLIILIIVLFFGKHIIAQELDSKFVGEYSNHNKYPSEILELKKDGTFKYLHGDPHYFDWNSYTNEGNWIVENNIVILNPDKEPRKLETKIIEYKKDQRDSIIIKINYNARIFHNEKIEYTGEVSLFTFDLYINGKRYFVTREPLRNYKKIRLRKKRHLTIDSLNTIRIPKSKVKSIKKIELLMLEFHKPVTFDNLNMETNFFEINIQYDIEKNREPRQKKVIIKKNKAYLWEYDNKIDTSIFAIKLKKRK